MKSDIYLKEDNVPLLCGKTSVGFIELAENFYINSYKKPCAWHRFWMKALLGWKWHDGTKLPPEDK